MLASKAWADRTLLEGIVERGLRLEAIPERQSDSCHEFPKKEGVQGAHGPATRRRFFLLHDAGTPSGASRSDPWSRAPKSQRAKGVTTAIGSGAQLAAYPSRFAKPLCTNGLNPCSRSSHCGGPSSAT